MSESRGNMQCLNCSIWEKSGYLYDETEESPLQGLGGFLCNVCYRPENLVNKELKDCKGLYKEIANKNIQITELWKEVDDLKGDHIATCQDHICLEQQLAEAKLEIERLN